MKVVAVSGGFDPIHKGHVRLIKAAMKFGDKLIVILTRDDQLIVKKGDFFMDYEERKKIIEYGLREGDEVVENIDSDITICKSLRKYKPDIFAQGGDRVPGNVVEKEVDICYEIGCKIIYNVGGGKAQSSSWLVNRWKQAL